MSDLDILLAAFESGELVRPSPDAPNIVDLANAIGSLNGVDVGCLTSGAGRIADLIGPSDHIVLTLADGFGMHFVDAMDDAAFVPRHTVTSLNTVFPSTTPVALTSLATGRWPAEHAVTGWHTYLPELEGVSTIIKFMRRSDEIALSEFGVSTEQVYPVESLLGAGERNFAALYPEDIANSVYSTYSCRGVRQVGYTSLSQAVDAVIRRVSGAEQPTFTYLYTPHPDKEAHRYGTFSAQAQMSARNVNNELERLARALPDNARLVMTADHGLVDAGEEEMHEIRPSDEVMSCLTREPSGDKRVMYFQVRNGDMKRFQKLFKGRFGERFLLISVDEAESIELFGPGCISSIARRRLGNVMAISKDANVISYRWPEVTKKEEPPLASFHSGLSPAEIRVPLVIA